MRRLPFALLAAAVAFALAQTGSSADPQPSVALLAIGDFGVAGSRERSLGAAMRRFVAKNDADALVTLGDNDYTESPTTFRAAWGQSFGWLRPAGVAVAGSLGNHDVRVQRGRYQRLDYLMSAACALSNSRSCRSAHRARRRNASARHQEADRASLRCGPDHRP